jgi:hypothetical protein
VDAGVRDHGGALIELRDITIATLVAAVPLAPTLGT